MEAELAFFLRRVQLRLVGCLHRTYARVLLGGGCDIAYVAQQLGHSPAVLLSTYTGVINASSGTEKGLAAIQKARGIQA